MADGLFLSRALQKTRIDVDEKGTRAEAVTAEATKTAESPMSLVFNRPFLYVIVHNKTGAILFLGICGDPSKFE
jgi:serine protease inhibitor